MIHTHVYMYIYTYILYVYIVTRMGKRKGGRRSREYLDILKSSMTKTAGWKEERKINNNGAEDKLTTWRRCDKYRQFIRR